MPPQDNVVQPIPIQAVPAQPVNNSIYYLYKVEIQNFRLLEKVNLLLEKGTTVIVGRNNSGKTSLTELFRRLLSDNSPSFSLEDFSLSAHKQFWAAYSLKYQNKEEKDIREALPIIEVKLTIKYDKASTNFGVLSDFIIDLNPNCTEALIVIAYQLKDGGIEGLFDGIDFIPDTVTDQEKAKFCRIIKERVSGCYVSSVSAVDPNDPTNQKPLEWTQLRALLHSGFINAQRGLDDITHKDRDVLGKILETLLDTAKSDSADPNDRDIAQNLEDAVEQIQEGIDTGFNKQLKDLLPAFSLFGYPGLSDPGLLTETTLDVQRLLTNHTKVHYAGVNGINLPEAYNGLGVRNLIFILLKLLEFYKVFVTRESALGIHLVFIEEPEVHLHPQMQEVFISKLNEIADVFSRKFNNGILWPVQFIVTTHSSHLANKASFESMRYFLASSDKHQKNIRRTQVKDLRNGLDAISPEDQKFLHQYMTLTRCDLLFADKAILIEGTSERLLLPKIIEKVDKNQSDGLKLSSQYVSMVEVGGAYAHRFFKLLDFLELRTLIITDLDATKKNAAQKYVACKVSEGSHTSNACLKDWFGDMNIKPADLIGKPDQEKMFNLRRIAYQMPETSGLPCGRSLEGAFMLANQTLFELSGASIEDQVWDKSRDEKKSEFALKYAIEETEWVIPRYIVEGLNWLAKVIPDIAITPPQVPLQPEAIVA